MRSNYDLKVTESSRDISRPNQIGSEWECVTLIGSLVSSDPGTWEIEGDGSDGGVFHWAISVPAATTLKVLVGVEDNNSGSSK